MTHHIIAGSATNPTFISQYGPLIAALVALTGVLITLIVNARRDRARYQASGKTTTDAINESPLRPLPLLATTFAGSAEHWLISPPGVIIATLRTMLWLRLLNELTVARLLIHDPTLQGGLNHVNDAWKEIAKALDEMEDSFLNQQPPTQTVELLVEALNKFDAAANILYTAALEKLKPTVAE